MHFLIIKKTPFILTKGDWFAVPPLLYRRNSSIHLILFFNGNDSGTAYCDFSVPAPKLPSASLFSSASQPMGISLCQNDLCILLFFNAFNWFINHETTKYHSHRSPVCQGFREFSENLKRPHQKGISKAEWFSVDILCNLFHYYLLYNYFIVRHLSLLRHKLSV